MSDRYTPKTFYALRHKTWGSFLVKGDHGGHSLTPVMFTATSFDTSEAAREFLVGVECHTAYDVVRVRADVQVIPEPHKPTCNCDHCTW